MDTYSASSTFDFASKGDLLLGLIAPLDGAPTGFQQIDFTVTLDGAEVVNEAFTSLVTADAFFDDQVINLGAVSGVADLTSRMISSLPAPAATAWTSPSAALCPNPRPGR